MTLSFSPYAEGLQGWIDMARAHGHEVLLEAPMEPVDYPDNDPAPTPYGRRPGAGDGQEARMAVSRATGYFGLTNYLGSRFLARTAPDRLLRRPARPGPRLHRRRLGGPRGGGVPRASAERVIDDQLNQAAIDQQLLALEACALQHGQALGSGFAYPVTLEEVAAWSRAWGARLPARAGLGRRRYAAALSTASGMSADLQLYRPNVGVVLFNPDGRVWLGRRADTPGPHNWQFPQGGVDGRGPEAAARRELPRRPARPVAPARPHQDWVAYDFPPATAAPRPCAAGRARSRSGSPSASRGKDADFDLPPMPAGVRRLALGHLDEAPELIVPFKRAAYARVVEAFGRFAGLTPANARRDAQER